MDCGSLHASYATAFYLTTAQVPGSKIVGQFNAPGGDSFGLLLEKDSKLTPCVNQALGKLESSGELRRITDKWMGASAGAPGASLKPDRRAVRDPRAQRHRVCSLESPAA